MVNPYKDEKQEQGFLREFEENVEIDDLVWHRDRQDRVIRIIEGRNWYLQYDNQLPILMEEGKEYFIKAEEYHRVIRGEGKLKLHIQEY